MCYPFFFSLIFYPYFLDLFLIFSRFFPKFSYSKGGNVVRCHSFFFPESFFCCCSAPYHPCIMIKLIIIICHSCTVKLTLNNDCTAVLAEHPTAFQSLLALINKHPDRNDLVVRVGFVLGNLTARNDDCRYCLFNTEGRYGGAAGFHPAILG